MKIFSLIGDSVKFEKDHYYFEMTKSDQPGVDEPSVALAPGGRMVALFRDEKSREAGGVGTNYNQAVSNDLGASWTTPEKTNIGAPYFCPNPLIIYDPMWSKPLVAVATDRRRDEPWSSKIWIYNNTVDEILSHPTGWTEHLTVNRPKANGYTLYGYPCATKMKNGRWLVVFTESSHDGVNEDADFWQFELSND
jgi:hypothetical protein